MKTLSVPDAASRMGLSVDEIVVLIRKGELLSIEIGGYKKETKYFVIEDSISDYMKKKSVSPKSKHLVAHDILCPVGALLDEVEWYQVTVKVVKDRVISQLKKRLHRNYLVALDIAAILDYFAMTKKLDFAKYRIHDHLDRDLLLTTPFNDLVPVKGRTGFESADEIFIIVEPRNDIFYQRLGCLLEKDGITR